MSQPDRLPHDIADALGRAAARFAPLNVDVVWYDEVGSTNDLVARLGEGGTPEGVVVVADAQTAGRGRLGRTWVSPPAAGIYGSVLLRPSATVVPLLTLAAGVAIADGIEAATGLSPVLKWPNDVFAGGRKLAGILAEGGDFVVLGFGINLRSGAFPSDIAARVTSLEEELGRPVDRGSVLAECLVALAARYAALQQGRRETVLQAWRARAGAFLGRPIEWQGAAAVAEGIADDGALLVRTDRGVERVVAGEIRWV